MNLHINHDDKFLDFFIENAEIASNTENRYLVTTSDKDLKLKFSKSQKIEAVYNDLTELKSKIGDIRQYKTIYCHYLNDFLVDFINSIEYEIKIVWIFWGADGFSRIKDYIERDCLESNSKRFYRNMFGNRIRLYKNPISTCKNFIEHKRISKKTQLSRSNYLKAITKIDYFAHYIKEDYEIIKKDALAKFKLIDFNYMSLNQLNIKENSRRTLSANILIGNSASITNNHIDIFKKLSNFNLLKIDKIYCPLSYAYEHEDYKKEVIKKGHHFLKDKFLSIENFIPLNEYNNILSTISMAIFGAIRSQAAGNIIALLYNGCRVYMPSKSTLYLFLKDKNVIVFNIENDLEKHLSNNKVFLLNDNEKLKNISSLDLIFGKIAMHDKYKKLLEI